MRENYYNENLSKIIDSFFAFNIDRRINSFFNYEFSNKSNLIKDTRELNEENMKILNNSLKIKNTIIIGEIPFHDFIKNLKSPTTEYFLKIEELNNFWGCSKIKRKIDNK